MQFIARELFYRLPEKGWNGRMSGVDDRHLSSAGPHMPEAAPHGFWHAARPALFGAIGVALITFAAIQFRLQRLPPPAGVGPGTISLLYLIVVAFVSLRAGFVSSVAVSLISAFCLNYFFLPLFPALRAKNPLGIIATVTFLITAWVITGMVALLRERNALLHGLFENGPQANALVDLDSRRVVRVNGEFTRIFGYTRQETQGRLLSELIVPANFKTNFRATCHGYRRGSEWRRKWLASAKMAASCTF